MAKYYEFWCRECGKHFYEESVLTHVCPNDGETLELTATVEGLSHLKGVMGIDFPYTDRKLIDKRSRK